MFVWYVHFHIQNTKMRLMAGLDLPEPAVEAIHRSQDLYTSWIDGGTMRGEKGWSGREREGKRKEREWKGRETEG